MASPPTSLGVSRLGEEGDFGLYDSGIFTGKVGEQMSVEMIFTMFGTTSVTYGQEYERAGLFMNAWNSAEVGPLEVALPPCQ